MTKQIYLVCVLLLSLNIWATAQTISTDRPDQTESSSTIPKRSFQIETGWILQQDRSGGVNIRSVAVPTALFRYGLFKWAEVRVITGYNVSKLMGNTFERRRAGFGDLLVGTKLQLFKRDSSRHEVAFLAHLIAPTGDKGMSTEHFGVSAKLSISHALCQRVGLGYNLGYEYFGTGKGRLIWTASLGYRPAEKLLLYIEPYGNWAEFDDVQADLDMGLAYLVLHNLQLDFSFGFGLNHQMNYMAMGVSWNIAPKS